MKNFVISYQVSSINTRYVLPLWIIVIQSPFFFIKNKYIFFGITKDTLSEYPNIIIIICTQKMINTDEMKISKL